MNSKKILFFAFCLLTSCLSVSQAKHYEIFLLAGQSNMDGRGPVKDLTGDLAAYASPRTDVLIRYSGGGLAQDLALTRRLQPLQPGFSANVGSGPDALPSTTFGPEVSFGAAMAEALPGKNILLIKFSKGGTDLKSQWNPNEKGKLYERFIEFVRDAQNKLKQNGDTFLIRGMLWHQGESDAALPPGEYEKLLAELILRVRSDLGLFPFVIGEPHDNMARNYVIAGQKEVTLHIPKTGFVSSEGLSLIDKGTHFDAAGQIELGKRFAKEMLRLMGFNGRQGSGRVGAGTEGKDTSKVKNHSCGDVSELK